MQRELVAVGAQPALVGFGITAHALAANEALALALVDRVRSLGCQIVLGGLTELTALDDLRRFHVDCLEIGHDVVCDLLTDSASERTLRAILWLADSLGLGTVAAGVDDRDTLERLRSLRVGHAQGDQIGRSMPALEILTATAPPARAPA